MAFLFTPMSLTLGSGDNNTTLSLALGSSTFINVTLTSASITLVGMSTIGGNIDGAVVCFSNVSTGGNTLTFAHASGVPLPANRFTNSGTVDRSAVQFGASWYRYSAVTLTWQQMMRA